ncbi:MAG TPA: hypothetical protein VFJ63_02435 [Candidatus Bathyarchaeia archaeon]|nr:hypothetical protein [Candidatus Bathyarchaeia archaeon]
MGGKKSRRVFPKSPKSILIIVLLIGFAVLTSFAVMSDNSVHGLTVRFSYVTRFCNTTATQTVLTYLTHPVIVYSSNSLETTISHVTFTMSVGGTLIGSTAAGDASFGPGQSYSYFLEFSNSTLDPNSQPLNSQVVLTITAQVSAGFLSSRVTASDTESIHFSSQTC